MINPSSNAGMRDPDVTVRRILKVNHAGEFGAIRIYGAQILMARRLFPSIVPALVEMREDDIVHCRLFREALPGRRARPGGSSSRWRAKRNSPSTSSSGTRRNSGRLNGNDR